MSKSEPIVQKYMSAEPLSVQSEDSVEHTQDVLSSNNIRHLPVLEGEKIYGIISDRDIKVALSLVGARAASMTASHICHRNPYQVSPETPLHEVVDEMASKHYGSAVVVQNQKLVGIFTTVDVCRALSDVLEQRHHMH